MQENSRCRECNWTDTRSEEEWSQGQTSTSWEHTQETGHTTETDWS